MLLGLHTYSLNLHGIGFRDDRIDFKRDGFRLTGTPVGEGDMDMIGAYEIIKTKSSMKRINIETDINIPLDDMEIAMAMEIDAIKRSAKFCRDVLGIKKNPD